MHTSCKRSARADILWPQYVHVADAICDMQVAEKAVLNCYYAHSKEATGMMVCLAFPRVTDTQSMNASSWQAVVEVKCMRYCCMGLTSPLSATYMQLTEALHTNFEENVSCLSARKMCHISTANASTKKYHL
jgi:hypothetical protein